MPINVQQILKAGANDINNTTNINTKPVTPPPLNKVDNKFDASSAANLAAIEKENREAIKRAAVTGQTVISKYPYEEVELPSKGYFYPSESPLALSNGVLQLKLMTAREEDILTSQNYIKKGIMLDKLLDALILTPGVKHEDMLVSDKNALYIYARILAYGEDYPVKITCPACSTEVNFDIKLHFPHKEFDFTPHTKNVNSFEFQLPNCKKNLVVKLLTGRDDNAISLEIKSLEKLNNPSKSELTTRLKHSIISVDGITDKAYIKNFVNDMLSKDALALRQYLRSITPELDLEFPFTCSKCGHEERMMLPLGVTFFYPDARV